MVKTARQPKSVYLPPVTLSDTTEGIHEKQNESQQMKAFQDKLSITLTTAGTNGPIQEMLTVTKCEKKGLANNNMAGG